MFRYLDNDAACKILRREIDKQNKTLLTRNYRFEMDDTTGEELVGKFFNKAGGGRSVRQFYNKLIRSQISKFILGDNAPFGEDETRTIYIDFDGKDVKLTGMKPEHPSRQMHVAAQTMTGAQHVPP
jgi:ATP-dependent Clp protease ATP-binding subunit ClpA